MAPSLLAGNHARLGESLALIRAAGASWVHLDIMDGHFVPNLTFGPQTVADLRREQPGLFFDVHLMLDNPHLFVEPFARAGASLISIHAEPHGFDHAATLHRIRELGCQCGIVINPGTPAEVLLPYLPSVDLVLIMTVQPGFGGQSFRQDCLEKVRSLHLWRQENPALSFRLEVDGGVDRLTGPLCVAAGADTLVAGTAFFRAPDPSAFLAALTASPRPS